VRSCAAWSSACDKKRTWLSASPTRRLRASLWGRERVSRSRFATSVRAIDGAPGITRRTLGGRARWACSGHRSHSDLSAVEAHRECVLAEDDGPFPTADAASKLAVGKPRLDIGLLEGRSHASIIDPPASDTRLGRPSRRNPYESFMNRAHSPGQSLDRARLLGPCHCR